MDSRNHLEEIHQETLKKLDSYMESKKSTDSLHTEKLNSAKEKWQVAWNEFLETLLALEKLEI